MRVVATIMSSNQTLTGVGPSVKFWGQNQFNVRGPAGRSAGPRVLARGQGIMNHGARP